MAQRASQPPVLSARGSGNDAARSLSGKRFVRDRDRRTVHSAHLRAVRAAMGRAVHASALDAAGTTVDVHPLHRGHARRVRSVVGSRADRGGVAMSAMLIVAGAVVAAVSGVPALLFPRGSRGGALAGDESAGSAPWSVPGGALNIRVDARSAFFVAPVFLIAGAGALFGERYWPASRERAAYVRAFYGILAGALARRRPVTL